MTGAFLCEFKVNHVCIVQKLIFYKLIIKNKVDFFYIDLKTLILEIGLGMKFSIRTKKFSENLAKQFSTKSILQALIFRETNRHRGSLKFDIKILM